MITFTDHLLPRIEAFLADRGMSPTAFGKSAAKDPSLVFEMRNGRELRKQTAELVVAFLETSEKDAA